MDFTLNNKVIVGIGAEVIGEAIVRVFAVERATPFSIERRKGDNQSLITARQSNRMNTPEEIANTVAFLRSEKVQSYNRPAYSRRRRLCTPG
jgi:NADP-dependent 3-hydroxy acid dehydrogenase YdfG